MVMSEFLSLVNSVLQMRRYEDNVVDEILSIKRRNMETLK